MNAFRSWNQSPTFKGQSADFAISRMVLNYVLLGTSFGGSQPSFDALKKTYGREQFEQDRVALNRLLFIYHVDRLRAKIEDQLRIFLEDKPERILKVDPSIASRLPSKVTAKSIAGLVDNAGDRLTRGSVKKIQKRFCDMFGFPLFSDAEISYLNYAFSLRNMLVHRDELVDARFLTDTGAKSSVGEEAPLPSVDRLGRVVIRLPHLLSRRLSGHDPIRKSSKYCRGNQ